MKADTVYKSRQHMRWTKTGNIVAAADTDQSAAAMFVLWKCFAGAAEIRENQSKNLDLSNHTAVNWCKKAWARGRNLMLNPVLSALNELLSPQGFVRKGTSFFRVYGDGILQVLQYEKELRPFYSERLWVGLFSMYGELQEQWFTRLGCITHYDTRYLKSPRWEREKRMRMKHETGHIELTPEDDIDWVTFYLDFTEIPEFVIPFLNDMRTQAQLLEGYSWLEYREYFWIEPKNPGEWLNWSNLFKFGAYVAVRDYASAKRILETVLAQHADALASREGRPGYQEYAEELYLEDRPLRDRLEMLERQDLSEINDYLSANYQKNVALARKHHITQNGQS